MGDKFTFYDYIDADGGGNNVIKDWLNGTGRAAKGYFTMIIPLLEASLPQGARDSFWGIPHTKRMKREWGGFIELRKTGKVQYRLFAQVRGRCVFLAAAGIHKGKNLKTDVSPQTAKGRVQQMIDNPAKYRRAHEYN